jgi:predicted nucleic acid-binding protein
VRSLLDTNLLVYADSSDERKKQRRAVQLIQAHRQAGTAVLPVQVLQEFTNVALRKLRLPVALIRERLNLYRRFELVPTTPDIIEGALNLHALHGLAFYDALIVQAAAVSGCQQVLSEDMQHGLRVAGVQIVNPFLAQ